VCDTLGKEWFWAETDRPRADDELAGIYRECRRRGVNLLLDVGPDRRGLITAECRDALFRLRKNAGL